MPMKNKSFKTNHIYLVWTFVSLPLLSSFWSKLFPDNFRRWWFIQLRYWKLGFGMNKKIGAKKIFIINDVCTFVIWSSEKFTTKSIFSLNYDLRWCLASMCQNTSSLLSLICWKVVTRASLTEHSNKRLWSKSDYSFTKTAHNNNTAIH